VDAWATWCHPCRKELPNVIAAYRTYHSRGLEMLGISMDSDLARLRPVMLAERIDWPHMMEDFNAHGPLATKLVITYIPTNFLIDANGILIATDLRGPNLLATLEKVIGAP
jgi:thiol-disulfide isomerase/thioredoxin